MFGGFPTLFTILSLPDIISVSLHQTWPPQLRRAGAIRVPGCLRTPINKTLTPHKVSPSWLKLKIDLIRFFKSLHKPCLEYCALVLTRGWYDILIWMAAYKIALSFIVTCSMFYILLTARRARPRVEGRLEIFVIICNSKIFYILQWK